MTYELHCDRAENLMAKMADNSIDLIVCDGPYHKVKNDDWDNVHKTAVAFIAWLDTILIEFHRILRPNGSLYMFASPRMAARVEVAIGEYFNPLNRIRWIKEAGWHNKNRKEDLRSYLSPWEEIIFAEHYGADNIAKGEAGYAAKCDTLRGFVFEPLRAYLDGERERAGVNYRQVNEIIGKPVAGGGMATHYFSDPKTLKHCQWALPTQEHYLALRDGFSRLDHGGEFLQRPYEDLRREYEELRTEYEELRTEYEELRRPFTVSADVPYTDVWTFPTVQAYRGKHSCEKPLAMIEHIVSASSKPGAVVFDPFTGSGVTGVACRNLDRDFIGCDSNQHWVDRSRQRIEAANMQQPLFEVAI